MGVYDYLASQYGKQAAQQFNSKSADTMSKVAASKAQFDKSSAGKSYNAKQSAPWISDQEKQETAAANSSYLEAAKAADKGMADNAPETDEERQSREKREKNQQILSGIGSAIDGVATAITGFSGGYIFPEGENSYSSADAVVKSINDAKAERLARAQRYYEFGKAKRKAFDDLIAAKADIADRRLKRRLTQSQIDENEANARRQDQASKPVGKSGGRSGGSSSDDPEKYPQIISSTGRKHKFRTTAQRKNACEAAVSKVPKQRPYYVQDIRSGELKLNGTTEQVVAQYAADSASDSNAEFWKIITDHALKSDEPRTDAIWLGNGQSSGSGSGSHTGMVHL